MNNHTLPFANSAPNKFYGIPSVIKPFHHLTLPKCVRVFAPQHSKSGVHESAYGGVRILKTWHTYLPPSSSHIRTSHTPDNVPLPPEQTQGLSVTQAPTPPQPVAAAPAPKSTSPQPTCSTSAALSPHAAPTARRPVRPCNHDLPDGRPSFPSYPLPCTACASPLAAPPFPPN